MSALLKSTSRLCLVGSGLREMDVAEVSGPTIHKERLFVTTAIAIMSVPSAVSGKWQAGW
jgi:hypothetical protein